MPQTPRHSPREVRKSRPRGHNAKAEGLPHCTMRPPSHDPHATRATASSDSWLTRNIVRFKFALQHQALVLTKRYGQADTSGESSFIKSDRPLRCAKARPRPTVAAMTADSSLTLRSAHRQSDRFTLTLCPFSVAFGTSATFQPSATLSRCAPRAVSELLEHHRPHSRRHGAVSRRLAAHTPSRLMPPTDPRAAGSTRDRAPGTVDLLPDKHYKIRPRLERRATVAGTRICGFRPRSRRGLPHPSRAALGRFVPNTMETSFEFDAFAALFSFDRSFYVFTVAIRPAMDATTHDDQPRSQAKPCVTLIKRPHPARPAIGHKCCDHTRHTHIIVLVDRS